MSVQSIPRPCKICRQITTNQNGYCDKHQGAYEEQEKRRKQWLERNRGSRHARGYDNLWYEVRRTYLMQHPLCEQCEKEGRITPAREVHHKVALRDGGERLNPDNFMALCRACHQKFTQEEIAKRRENQG